MNTLRTTLIWHDSTGGECECEAVVKYRVTPGYPQSWEEPSCDAEVEILGIRDQYGDPVAYDFDDEDLKSECFTDWVEAEADAAERAAEMRSEMNREDRR